MPKFLNKPQMVNESLKASIIADDKEEESKKDALIKWV